MEIVAKHGEESISEGYISGDEDNTLVRALKFQDLFINENRAMYTAVFPTYDNSNTQVNLRSIYEDTTLTHSIIYTHSNAYNWNNVESVFDTEEFSNQIKFKGSVLDVTSNKIDTMNCQSINSKLGVS